MRIEKLSRLSIILIAGLAFGTAAAAGGVMPPFSSPFGQSYSGWSAEWWQWAFSLPTDGHPLFDTADCSAGQSGKVWFLGGTFAVTEVSSDSLLVIGEAERDCTVKPGTALFFPILNIECDNVGFPALTETDLRDCANDLTIAFWFNIPVDEGYSVLGKRAICGRDPFLDIRTGSTGPSISRSQQPGTELLPGCHPQTSGLASLDLTNTAMLGLSNSPCIAADGTKRLMGQIDDLRIYSRVLSDVEIASLVDLVFADTLESGDTSAWSTTVP